MVQEIKKNQSEDNHSLKFMFILVKKNLDLKTITVLFQNIWFGK
jgi:hypothetical protein